MSLLVRGVVPPIVTPLKPGGSVDSTSLERIVTWQLASGAHGVFALGSTGEAAYLTDAQRAEVVAMVVDLVAGRVPVLAGALDTATERVLAQAQVVVHAGADAVVATAPFYARTSDAEISRHFSRLTAGAGAPVLAYNIPLNVHRSLPVEVVANLLANGELAGIKDSSGDIGWVRSLLERIPNRAEVSVLTGSDVLADIALDLGCHGIVAGLANIDPAGFVRLFEHHCASDREATRLEQRRIEVLATLYDGPANGAGANALDVGAIKAALVHQGLIGHDRLCEPMTPVSDELRRHARDVLRAVGMSVRSSDQETADEHQRNPSK